MALNNENANFGIGNELDLFITPPINTSVKRHFISKVYPLNSVKEGGPIEFVITSNKENFIDLNETYISLTCSIKKSDGSNPPLPDAGESTAPKESQVVPVNFFIGALFKDVELYLGGKMISSSNNLYPYKSYLEFMMNYSEDTKKEIGGCGMYWKMSGEDEYEETDVHTTKEAHSLKKRWDITKHGKTFELFGRLHHDLFQQQRLFPGDLALRIKLIRNDTKFCLMSKDPDSSYKIIIEEAKLNVKRKEVSLNYLRDVEKQRSQGEFVRYPYKHVVMKYSNQSPHITNLSEHRLISNSPRPDRIVIGLVHADAFNGSLNKNPFYFNNYGVEHIHLTTGLLDMPYEEMKLDYSNNLFREAYIALLHNTSRLFKNSSIGIDPSEFAEGLALYCFDLTKTGVDDKTFELTENDTIHVDIKLKKALDHALVIVFYMEFSQMLALGPSNDINLSSSI